MDFEKIYQMIINEPIYLTVVIIFLLIIAYSILKKLFKILVISLVILMCYMGYLMYTGQELPNEEELNSMKQKGMQGVETVIDKLDKLGKSND